MEEKRMILELHFIISSRLELAGINIKGKTTIFLDHNHTHSV